MSNQTLMKRMLDVINGFLLALVIVLSIVAWKSFPFRDLYLSDMENWEIIKWTWGQPQRNATIDGAKLVINEVAYEKGIGTHAPTILKIPVPPGYTRFVADAGVSDAVPNDAPSSVTFKVIGDGVVLFETPIIRATMPAWRVDVNIQWTNELLLEDRKSTRLNSSHRT